jgi:hypothetical protein
MRVNILKITAIAVALSLAGASAFAQSPNGVVANIPFEFMVGDQTIPAGNYLLVSTDFGTTITVQQLDGSTRLTLAAMMGRRAEAPPVPKVLFNRYGQRYFLSQVLSANSETVYKIPRSKAEVKLAQGHAKPAVTAVIAQSH